MPPPSRFSPPEAGASALAATPAFVPGTPRPAGPGAFGDEDYRLFQQKIQSRTGIRLVDYKPEQMRRRISTAAQRAGFGSFAAYVGAMERNAALLENFLETMTINVTELLRNPPRFDDLSRVILPGLVALRGQATPLSLWSAGCSYGAEAYTLALLLEEMAPRVPHRIKGTDIDEEILAKARNPRFTAADMVNVSPARRAAHFQEAPEGTFVPRPALSARVQWAKHDLLAGAYPRAQYDLIACRNVVIYFTDEAKERVYRGFFEALKPGGVLFVGGTERLADHRAIGFDLALPFFYRKPCG